ncbi:MAG: VTT domain-containing protein [Patescibacteria group bacterium]|nr:VTT domain-containing protein [Patescibacteria group bacterium]
MKKQKENILYRYKNDIIVGFVFIFLIAVFFFGKDYFNIFENREVFEEFISGFGVFGPLILTLIVVLEVVVAPIPGFVISLTAGFLFGSIAGSICVYLGNIIGTMLVFWFARKFGKPVVERFIKKEKLVKYEKIVSKRENFLLFFYFLPILPIDIVTAVFGLSRIKIKKFLIIVLIGYIPYSIIVTNFGDYLADWFFLL